MRLCKVRRWRGDMYKKERARDPHPHSFDHFSNVNINKILNLIKMSDAVAAAPATPKAVKVAKPKKVAAKKAPADHPKVN